SRVSHFFSRALLSSLFLPYPTLFRSFTREQRALTVFFTLMFGGIFAVIPLLTPLTKSRWRGGFSITLTLLPLVNAAALFLALFADRKSTRLNSIPEWVS